MKTYFVENSRGNACFAGSFRSLKAAKAAIENDIRNCRAFPNFNGTIYGEYGVSSIDDDTGYEVDVEYIRKFKAVHDKGTVAVY